MKLLCELFAWFLSWRGYLVMSKDVYHALCINGCIDNKRLLEYTEKAMRK